MNTFTFTCTNPRCGASNPRDATSCHRCGSLFEGVRCNRCGFTWKVERWVGWWDDERCPLCDGLTDFVKFLGGVAFMLGLVGLLCYAVFSAAAWAVTTLPPMVVASPIALFTIFFIAFYSLSRRQHEKRGAAVFGGLGSALAWTVVLSSLTYLVWAAWSAVYSFTPLHNP